MKYLLTCLLLLTVSVTSVAQITPEWVRYPAISPQGDAIAFTYKGDIYRVSSQGGEATRLTFHGAHDYNAVWSHDGQQIAFASDRFGNFDVYVMDALGGQASRLTYHSSDEIPYTFSKDNQRVLFEGQRMDTAEHRQFPSNRLPELYSVLTTGGGITQVFSHSVEDVQFNNNGNEFVYTDNKGAENKWRKHHKSSATRDIWRYNLDTKKHEQLSSFEGEDRNPVYSNDNKNVYYLSEESGSFNVHRLSVNRPSRNKQLSDFSLHPVRFLSKGTHNNKDILAFSYHGNIYTMLDGEEPSRVNITIRTQDIANNEEFVSVDGDISEMTISPNGKEIAFVSNGEVFVSSTDGKFVKQITQSASQERFVNFSPEGDYLLYAAERNSKWNIYKASIIRDEEPFFYASTLISEESFIENTKDNYLPKISPDGTHVAFVEDRRTLKLLNIESGETKVLVQREDMIHMRDGDQVFSWSPDSQWILLQFDKLLNNADVALININGTVSKKVIVPSAYFDVQPKWVNDGEQIIWFSNRNGLKSYATSGRSQYDVYSLFFTQKGFDEFNLSEKEFALMEAIEEAQKEESEKDDDAQEDDKQDAKAPPAKLEIEWDGMRDRIVKLTIHSSFLDDAVLNIDASKLYYLSKFEKDYDLWETDLRTQDTRKLVGLNAKGGQLKWDPEMENLYLLSDGRISRIDTDAGSVEGIGISEQMKIDHDALFAHSFEHVWLRTSKIFYEPTYHGIDWQQMYTEYQPKVAHVGNGHEYTELLSEMLGELNVSHSGSRYRSSNKQDDETAALGIFYEFNHQNNGIKITEVINDGPLDKANFDVSAGMLIEKIDGITITSDIDWHKLLNRKVGKFVLLDILDGNKRTQITVKPISRLQQNSLLYKRFVRINEQEVLEKSKGKLGYVHIPSMSDEPYRSMYDDIMGRFYDKQAMVIDTRFNGGGDLVADLAMFFTGESFLTYATEDKVVGGEPTSRYTKPVITLFNENMYSDGHCYASGWTDLKLGKSVGMPVPGTCSFAGWESLPMGGYWGVVPISAKNKKGEWLENNQTEPDILVKNEASVITTGRDQQLEKAISELLKQIR